MPATRRRFLVAAGLSALPMVDPSEEDELVVLGRRLTGLLTEPASACHIAATYARERGGIGWRQAALELDMPAVLAPANDIVATAALRAWLGARIRADFATGDVMDLGGWRLSRTEVGACVLALGAA